MKTPGSFPPGAIWLVSVEPTRSRNEVAVDAHAVDEHFLVVEGAHASRLSASGRRGVERGATLVHRVQMAVEAFQTDVEVLRDVPLGARRDAPVLPVEGAGAASRAARTSQGGDAVGSNDAEGVDLGAHLVRSRRVVADVGVGADQRRAQAWGPVVLVGRLSAPRGGQVEA